MPPKKGGWGLVKLLFVIILYRCLRIEGLDMTQDPQPPTFGG